MNYAMHHKVKAGEAINIADHRDNGRGGYLLPLAMKERLLDGADLCDLDRDKWIWLVVEPNDGGPLVAFADPHAKVPAGHTGIWFR